MRKSLTVFANTKGGRVLVSNDFHHPHNAENMEIYHGGYCLIENPKIIEGKYAKDFGTGFYCTEIREQSVRWAKRYDTPTVNVYNFQIDSNLNIRNFEEMTEEWLAFIVDCRNNVKHNFDIVVGAMANDQIYNYIADYISGTLTKEQFWVLAKFKHPTHQISFCTNEALKCLTFIKKEEIEK
ncbi:MAG: DUF3990 domain-containing protein [Bacteroidales bacterium]|jgi:hypothetical protein|nr:DUF3990 domain-containing protein [Bacteroidales bacterium]